MTNKPEQMDFGSGYSGRYVSWSHDRELNPQYDGIPDVERAALLLTCPHGDGAIPILHPGHAVYGTNEGHAWKV